MIDSSFIVWENVHEIYIQINNAEANIGKCSHSSFHQYSFSTLSFFLLFLSYRSFS